MRSSGFTLCMLLLATVGCSQRGSTPLISHSNPGAGVRIVEITVPKGGASLDLRWQYGKMTAPKKYASLSAGSAARIIVVEELNSHCGAYIVQGGSTHKLELPIPEAMPDESRTVAVTCCSPSLEAVSGSPQEIMKIEWINGNDSADNSRRVLLATFQLAVQEN